MAGPLIRLLYGPAYDAGRARAGAARPVHPVHVPQHHAGPVVIAAKRQIVWTWVMAGATIVNPAINAVLIPMTQKRLGNGAVGAAIALLLTEVVIVAAGFWIVGRGVADRRMLRRVGLSAVASAAMWGVSFALRDLGAAVSVAAGGLTFLLLATVLRLVTPTERAFVRERAGRVTSRFAARLRVRSARSSPAPDPSAR